MSRPTIRFEDLEYITAAEAGELLRCTPRIAYERACDGEFGERVAVRDGRRWLIRQAAIRAHLRRLTA